MDMLIDAQAGEVTVRTEGKDGKEESKSEHLDLPSDLSNGLVPILIENLPAGIAEKTVSMIVAAPKPRLVKLDISPDGTGTCSLIGVPRKAIHYKVKIDLGAVAGAIAPLIGKAPPTIQIWAIPGDAATFLREEGPIYSEGPLMTIQVVSPSWRDSARSGE
jgi:hypothetical protein